VDTLFDTIFRKISIKVNFSLMEDFEIRGDDDRYPSLVLNEGVEKYLIYYQPFNCCVERSKPMYRGPSWDAMSAQSNRRSWEEMIKFG
jgi:hypothetical protein